MVGKNRISSKEADAKTLLIQRSIRVDDQKIKCGEDQRPRDKQRLISRDLRYMYNSGSLPPIRRPRDS